MRTQNWFCLTETETDSYDKTLTWFSMLIIFVIYDYIYLTCYFIIILLKYHYKFSIIENQTEIKV